MNCHPQNYIRFNKKYNHYNIWGSMRLIQINAKIT